MFFDEKRSLFHQYKDWYDGKHSSLYTSLSPSVSNGLKHIPPANAVTYFNAFSLISRFYNDQFLADLPVGFHNGFISRMIRDWSITGDCAYMLYQGRLMDIPARNIVPIYDSTGDLERWIIYRPIKSHTTPLFDRARVINYNVQTGQASLTIRNYRPGWIDDTPNIGSPVSVSNLRYITTDDDLYADLRNSIIEINIRMNLINVSLNSSSYPVLQIDTNSVSNGKYRGKAVSTAELFTLVNDGLGITITPPFTGETGASYVERSGTGLTESLEYLDKIMHNLGIQSGVPDYIFGIRTGNNSDSERVLLTAAARIGSFRLLLASALAEIGITLPLSAEPYVSRSQRVQTAINLFEKGIIGLQEARQVLGL